MTESLHRIGAFWRHDGDEVVNIVRALFVVAVLVALGVHFERATVALALSAAILAMVLLPRHRRD